MGRLPYDKQYELAYQIYEALCAQHPDRLVALSAVSYTHLTLPTIYSV